MLIVIEGCVGAGKTTVAKGLAARRNSMLLLENFELNPFLRSFYKDPTANATETELAFLLLHYHQLRNHIDTSSANNEIIADFHLGKDLLYADLNLRQEKVRNIFTELYELFLDQTPSPTLLVFLSSSTELIVERIRKRNRDFELEIDSGYYAQVNSAYEEFFTRYAGRKLRVSMDECDFVKDPNLFAELALRVDGALTT
jgi:deoxyguanosine kinase